MGADATVDTTNAMNKFAFARHDFHPSRSQAIDHHRPALRTDSVSLISHP